MALDTSIFFFYPPSISSKDAGQLKAPIYWPCWPQEGQKRKRPCREAGSEKDGAGRNWALHRDPSAWLTTEPAIPPVLGKSEQRPRPAWGTPLKLPYSLPFKITQSVENRSVHPHRHLKFSEEKIGAAVVESRDFEVWGLSLNHDFPLPSRAHCLFFSTGIHHVSLVGLLYVKTEVLRK